MKKAKTLPLPKILAKSPTGFRGLDGITGGGLPKGRPTLVCGGAGCGKTLLGMEFLVRGATEFGDFDLRPNEAAPRPPPERGRRISDRSADHPLAEAECEKYLLRLHIAGSTPQSR